MKSIEDKLDMALASKNGLALDFVSETTARTFRTEAYKLRAREREESKNIYPAGSPRWGTSRWDKLRLQYSRKYTTDAVYHRILIHVKEGLDDIDGLLDVIEL